MSDFITIEGHASAEIDVKKSRFISQISHVSTEEEALAFLAEIKEANRMARHNVYAYVIRDEGATARIRYSDDGEPQKTAGIPTLEVIQHAQLVDVCLVTTRYFGGILLGTGGLVRAYTQSAQAAIAAAEQVRFSSCVDIQVTIPYTIYDIFHNIALSCNAQIVDTQFTEAVTIELRMLEGTEHTLLLKIEELTKGACVPTVSQPFIAAFQR